MKNWRLVVSKIIKILSIFAIYFSLIGCVSDGLSQRISNGFDRTPAPPPKQEIIDNSKQNSDDAFNEYVKCMKAESNKLLKSKSTAYEIADATQASCSRDFNKFELAYRDMVIIKNNYYYDLEIDKTIKQSIDAIGSDAKSQIVLKVVESRK